jgi:hypothetical protein
LIWDTEKKATFKRHEISSRLEPISRQTSNFQYFVKQSLFQFAPNQLIKYGRESFIVKKIKPKKIAEAHRGPDHYTKNRIPQEN